MLAKDIRRKFAGYFAGKLPRRTPQEVFVTQLCPTLCDPMVYRPPGSSVQGDSPGKNTAVGCHALLQGIFPTQGSNPGAPHRRRILYHLSHQGSPYLRKDGLFSYSLHAYKWTRGLKILDSSQNHVENETNK